MSVRNGDPLDQQRTRGVRRAMLLIAILGAIGTFLTGVAAIISALR